MWWKENAICINSSNKRLLRVYCVVDTNAPNVCMRDTCHLPSSYLTHTRMHPSYKDSKTFRITTERKDGEKQDFYVSASAFVFPWSYDYEIKWI